MHENWRESGDVEHKCVGAIGAFEEGKLRITEENNNFIEVVKEEVSVKLFHKHRINAIENNEVVAATDNSMKERCMVGCCEIKYYYGTLEEENCVKSNKCGQKTEIAVYLAVVLDLLNTELHDAKNVE